MIARRASSLRARLLAAALCSLACAAESRAQGVTTGMIVGSVRAEDGATLDGVRVRVVHTTTGFAVETEARGGRFAVLGLEVGGPYVVLVRRIGYVPQRSEPQLVMLGEPLEVHLLLRRAAVALDTVHASMERSSVASAGAQGGAVTLLRDSLLRRLPTMNRDFYDFVRLVPQVSAKIGLPNAGFSAGGMGFRYNNFLINGAPERLLGGGGSIAFAGGRSIPLDAVKEYQVLLAPFDVRYGDFAGALVSTVTQSGTNRVQGSVFANTRSDAMARGTLPGPAYERVQAGLALGGPIVRDRLHLFVAPELQRLSAAAAGPYVGQPPGSLPALPVRAEDLAQLSDVMQQRYGLTAGSGGAATNESPLANVFARADLAIPEWRSRAVLWHAHGRAESGSFARTRELFSLTTSSSVFAARTWQTSFQLHTSLPRAGGGHNELLVAHRAEAGDWHVPVAQPIVRVVVPNPEGGLATIGTGTTAVAHGQRNRAGAVTVRNTLGLQLGAHLLTVGAEMERFALERAGVLGAYGSWTFSSIDSLARGLAESYELRRDFGSAGVPLRGTQWAAHVGDRWHAGDHAVITFGVRADLLAVDGHAPYSRVVDSIFGRRTDATLRGPVHLSPRVGVTWDPAGAGRDQIRGGIGVYAGRPPLAWIHAAHYNYGVGIGVLRCGGPGSMGTPPAFSPDHRAPPLACAGGAPLSTAPAGDVDLLAPRLGMARALRGSLAYDRRFPGGVVVGAEALVTRALADYVFANLGLGEPLAVDRRGRAIYGTVAANGVATPARRSSTADVFELRTTDRNRSYQLTARLEKDFSRGIAAMASYTHSGVRDVQTPLRVNNPGLVTWGSARAFSGRHDDPSPSVSSNDVPHRVVLAGTLGTPARRWRTELSFYYVGESGRAFTYLAGGVGGRGDLNADGSNADDPVYVPRSALDPDEIRFSGRSTAPGADNSPAAQFRRIEEQGAAFQRFVEASECLGSQRGRIVARNSCREPWSHTTLASLRQSVPVAGRALELQVDAFNVLNLLNPAWGHYRVAAPVLLEHVSQATEAPAEPVFRFDPATPRWSISPVESAFQLQLGVRYRFGARGGRVDRAASAP